MVLRFLVVISLFLLVFYFFDFRKESYNENNYQSICSKFQDDYSLMTSLNAYIKQEMVIPDSQSVIVSIYYSEEVVKYVFCTIKRGAFFERVDDFSDVFLYSNYNVFVKTGFDFMSNELINNGEKYRIYFGLCKKSCGNA